MGEKSEFVVEAVGKWATCKVVQAPGAKPTGLYSDISGKSFCTVEHS